MFVKVFTLFLAVPEAILTGIVNTISNEKSNIVNACLVNGNMQRSNIVNACLVNGNMQRFVYQRISELDKHCTEHTVM